MTYTSENGVSRGAVNIYGQVTTIGGRIAQTFEDTVQMEVPQSLGCPETSVSGQQNNGSSDLFDSGACKLMAKGDFGQRCRCATLGQPREAVALGILAASVKPHTRTTC
jgi:hypothetical protein